MIGEKIITDRCYPKEYWSWKRSSFVEILDVIGLILCQSNWLLCFFYA